MKKRIILLWACLLLAGCGARMDSQVPSADRVQIEEPEQTREQHAEDTLPETTPPETMPSETQPLPRPSDEELVRVVDYIPEIRQELAYATGNNFTGQQIYDFQDAYLRYGTVRKLTQVSRELARQGLGLLIWDGFRPVSAQEKLWEICPDTTYVSHPVTGGRAHCRGSAVDVTLVSLETGEELPMPTGFDDFSELADRDYSDCSDEAAANARLLEHTMEKYGFQPYQAEWWHFSDTNEYPVEENFEPPAG